MTVLSHQRSHGVARSGEAVQPPPFPGVLFGAVLLVTVSRGAVQLLVGQSVAYFVQTGAVGLFVLAICLRGRSSATRWSGSARFLFGSFAAVAAVSASASLWLNGIELGLLLAGVMGFLALLLAGTAARDFQWTKMNRAGGAVVAVVWLQVIVAGMQQFLSDRTFPGNAHVGDLVRPAALTGSYLHYPIELALLSLALVGMFAARRRWIYLVTALAGMGSVILSQGRSGMVLVLAGIAIGTLFLQQFGARLRIVAGACMAVVALLIFFPANDFISRFLSIGVVEGNINEVRVGIWNNVLDTWSSGPLLIGVHTGEFTNVGNRLTDADKAGVTESGILAMLINFGVLGLVTFYGLMLTAAFSAPRRSWYQAALLAGIIQSCVYQSVEVFPFMAVFTMIPLIGRAFDADVKRDESADEQPAEVGGRPT